jgi:hypothetical protein
VAGWLASRASLVFAALSQTVSNEILLLVNLAFGKLVRPCLCCGGCVVVRSADFLSTGRGRIGLLLSR